MLDVVNSELTRLKEVNDGINTQSKVKESKVKESTLHETKVKCSKVQETEYNFYELDTLEPSLGGDGSILIESGDELMELISNQLK